ncbi:MAG: hypothetical protein OEY38_22830 [Gammaproteobacteria bacterium]|nr:hypothetical protein [Gammaproteobacteria bacterium]
MKSKNDQIEVNETRKAFDAIQQARSIGIQRAVPPIWFGLTIALLTGSIFILAGFDVSRIYMAPVFILMVIIVIHQTKKSGVIAKLYPSRQGFFLVISCVAVISIPFIFVARELRDTYGLIAPFSIGVLISLFCVIAFVLERRVILKK